MKGLQQTVIFTVQGFRKKKKNLWWAGSKMMCHEGNKGIEWYKMDNSNTLKSMLIREFHSKFKVTKVYKYAKRGIR